MRLWHELLASVARLARGRGVESIARAPVGEAAGSRPDRLVACHRGQLQREGCAGRTKTGRNPTDRGKTGSKHHVITDASGIPLATTLTGANAHDVTQLLPLVEAIPPIAGKPGRPRHRPHRVQGDRGYDSQPHRDELRRRGIASNLARRNTEHGSGLGKHRWVVERTIAWLHQFRRLRIRYERRDDIHQAFMAIGCALICFNYLNL
jgi:transposase